MYIPCNISLKNVIFNCIHENPKHLANTLSIILKQYVYRQRCKNARPNAPEFRNLVYQTENLEKFIAVKNDKIDKHYLKWKGHKINNKVNLLLSDYVEVHVNSIDVI